jgi:hypothetical protein
VLVDRDGFPGSFLLLMERVWSIGRMQTPADGLSVQFVCSPSRIQAMPSRS